MYKIMTPGPTQVKENVRMAQFIFLHQSDLDEITFEIYKETQNWISRLPHTGMRPRFRRRGILV